MLWFLETSSINCCIRFSNWPRIPVPCTKETTSKRMISLFASFSGTSPDTIAVASPSTTEVFPTPASPIKTGLFLVRRFKISMTRWISLSRPMTGSILPWRARSVILIPNCPKTPFPRRLLPPWRWPWLVLLAAWLCMLLIAFIKSSRFANPKALFISLPPFNICICWFCNFS